MNEQSGSNNNKIGIILIIALVIVGAIAAWYFLIYKPAEEAKEQARLEQIAQEQAEQKRREEAARRKARFDQLVQDADTEFDQENWAAAQSLYSEASSLIANQQYVLDRLSIINDRLDELAAIEARKATGVVEKVSEKTGLYYVIVSSSVDEDLAMDFAIKLAKEGNQVKVIEHEASDHIYYRVAMDEFATESEAKAAIPQYASYGENIWALKY